MEPITARPAASIPVEPEIDEISALIPPLEPEPTVLPESPISPPLVVPPVSPAEIPAAVPAPTQPAVDHTPAASVPPWQPPEPPTPAPVAEPASPAPLPVAAPAWQPPAPSVVPAPVVPPAAAPVTPAPPDEDFWESVLREHQELPSVVSPTPVAQAPATPAPVLPVPEVVPSPLPRPSTVVNVAPAPQPPATPTAPAGRASNRPRAVVRAVPDAPVGSSPSPVPAPASRELKRAASASVPDIVLVAPVEMWFGESRIGVKPGTRTYDQFRKYADVLMADLKAAKKRDR